MSVWYLPFLAVYKAVCCKQPTSASYVLLSCPTHPSLWLTSSLPAKALVCIQHIFPWIWRKDQEPREKHTGRKEPGREGFKAKLSGKKIQQGYSSPHY